MKKFHIIILILFGFLMTPTAVFACGKHTGKQSCKKKLSNKQEDNCCSGYKHSAGKHDGCGGKCSHKQCGCASVTASGLSFISPIEFNENAIKSIVGKQRFYLSDTTVSSGFYSLWLIPKIS